MSTERQDEDAAAWQPGLVNEQLSVLRSTSVRSTDSALADTKVGLEAIVGHGKGPANIGL